MAAALLTALAASPLGALAVAAAARGLLKNVKKKKKIMHVSKDNALSL